MFLMWHIFFVFERFPLKCSRFSIFEPNTVQKGVVPCKRWYKHTNLRKLSVVLLRHTYPCCSWCLMFEIHHLNYCSVDTHANISALLLIRNVVLRRNRSRCFGAVLRAAVCTHVLYTALYSLKCISKDPSFKSCSLKRSSIQLHLNYPPISEALISCSRDIHAPGTAGTHDPFMVSKWTNSLEKITPVLA